MDSIEKQAWLARYGLTQFEFKNVSANQYTVQWRVTHNKARLYVGSGTDQLSAYDDLYDAVVDTLYDYCR